MDHRLSNSELEALNGLLGRAVFDPALCARVLSKEEHLFVSEHRLSETTWRWLKRIPFNSLQQLAQALQCSVMPDDDLFISKREVEWWE